MELGKFLGVVGEVKFIDGDIRKCVEDKVLTIEVWHELGNSSVIFLHEVSAVLERVEHNKIARLEFDVLAPMFVCLNGLTDFGQE